MISRATNQNIPHIMYAPLITCFYLTCTICNTQLKVQARIPRTSLADYPEYNLFVIEHLHLQLDAE